MDQVETAKQKFKEGLQTRTCPMHPNLFNEVFEELWAKHIQPEIDKVDTEESDQIRWRIGRTKPLNEILPGDVPRGLNAEDIATDSRKS